MDELIYFLLHMILLLFGITMVRDHEIIVKGRINIIKSITSSNFRNDKQIINSMQLISKYIGIGTIIVATFGYILHLYNLLK